MKTQKTNQLKALAQAINQEIQTIAQSSFNTGKYLAQAKELFTIASQFVKWAESECSLKKAQVYRLVSVYNTYKNEKALHTLSVDVLATLSGCSEDVKEIVKAIAANGESVSLKELKAIKDEVEPGHKKEAKAPNKEANKVIENLESQLTSIKQGKAQAIETAKKAQDELQAALARIKQLEADNKALSNKVEELEATNRELVLQIEQSKTQSSTLDSQEVTQLDKACTEYVRLLKLNPRQMVNNTVQAVEYAGGEVVGSGRLQTFVLDGHTLTGQEVRIEASHYNN